MKKTICFLSALFLWNLPSLASSPDWSQGFAVPDGGRNNPYSLAGDDWQNNITAGRLHTLSYPVSVTGLLPPYQPFVNLLNDQNQSGLKSILLRAFSGLSHIHSFNDLMRWVGLHPYPAPTATGIYAVPYPNNTRPDYPMGLTLMERNGATGFTISCAACHSANLFGKTVLGLTNRFPRANDAFVYAKDASHFANAEIFKISTGATAAEGALMQSVLDNIDSVGVKKPVQLGLDTSLAQVALSLARRNQDDYATRNSFFEHFPRKEMLDSFPADSKPAVWWNLKYKDRWLSDGSVISGNPIFTNILWNEIGRGADLKELGDWLKTNEQKIQELTAAVFAVEAPRFTDFFPAESLNLGQAKQGEQVFLHTCAGCHGTYDKAWNQANASALPLVEQLKTTMVHYRPVTRVVDVGTDPNRYQGMKSLEQLNNLAISKENGTIVEAQTGYVPPPLVGIWARWPYFHNNSAPSLCAVLTPAALRPKSYYAGEANDPTTDFDKNCNGYPAEAPAAWKQDKYLYDTSRAGMSNSGHDEDIFVQNGQEILSPADKSALIVFLQTL